MAWATGLIVGPTIGGYLAQVSMKTAGLQKLLYVCIMYK
jgi:hypothetical protein